MATLSRADWGALPPKSAVTLLDAAVQKGVAAHYLGPSPGPYTQSKAATLVRGIQKFHQQDRGWNDVAYSFIIDKYGTVYECRGWGVRTAANGTNTGNGTYHAICFLIGDGDELTQPMKVAFNALVGEWEARYKRKCDVKPHRHFKATACPGKPVLDWLNLGRPVTGASVPVQPPAPSMGTGTQVYTVRAGDTLWEIGRLYRVSVANLRSWNALTSDTIHPGQRLRLTSPGTVPIPASTGAQRPVQNGGTGAWKREHRTLRLGGTGLTVKHWQELVGVTADGAFGTRTRQATIRFQTAKGITPDGVVGPVTWAAAHATVKVGSRGDTVREIQREVGVAADGIYGPQTAKAVASRQRALWVSADGIVGPATYRALGK